MNARYFCLVAFNSTCLDKLCSDAVANTLVCRALANHVTTLLLERITDPSASESRHTCRQRFYFYHLSITPRPLHLLISVFLLFWMSSGGRIGLPSRCCGPRSGHLLGQQHTCKHFHRRNQASGLQLLQLWISGSVHQPRHASLARQPPFYFPLVLALHPPGLTFSRLLCALGIHRYSTIRVSRACAVAPDLVLFSLLRLGMFGSACNCSAKRSCYWLQPCNLLGNSQELVRTCHQTPWQTLQRVVQLSSPRLVVLYEHTRPASCPLASRTHARQPCLCVQPNALRSTLSRVSCYASQRRAESCPS